MSMKPIFEVIAQGCEPYLGSETAGGIDLRVNSKDIYITPNTEYEFGLGVKVAIPKGWVGLLLPRSGMGTQYKLRLANTAGVIDSDYRGEIKVICTFEKAFWLQEFERIAQLLILPCRVDFELGVVPNDTKRGYSGFGDSGRL